MVSANYQSERLAGCLSHQIVRMELMIERRSEKKGITERDIEIVISVERHRMTERNPRSAMIKPADQTPAMTRAQ